MGSSCHIKGARGLIEGLNEFLKEHNLEDKVELKGAFCMERCGEGINWQIDDEPVTSATVEDAIGLFMKRVVEPLNQTDGKE